MITIQLLQMDYDLIIPETLVGEDMEVGVKLKNTGAAERNVKVRLTLASTFYTGVSGRKVKGEVTEIKLKPDEGRHLKNGIWGHIEFCAFCLGWMDGGKDWMDKRIDVSMTGHWMSYL